MVKQFKSPGPKYAVPTTIGYENTDLRLPRAPAYTMGQLLQQKQRRALGVPGPKYDLSNVTRHGRVRVPGALLLGPRIKERRPPVPGPGTYNVVPCIPATTTSTPVYSMGWKVHGGWTKRSLTPAPNKYSLGTTIGNGAPDMPSAPMYSIQGRREKPAGRRITSFASPGPARYSAVPLDKTMPQPPRPVMFGRHADGAGRRRGTPGPNAYQPGGSSVSSRHPTAPQFSLSGRYPVSSVFYTPADLTPAWDC